MAEGLERVLAQLREEVGELSQIDENLDSSIKKTPGTAQEVVTSYGDVFNRLDAAKTLLGQLEEAAKDPEQVEQVHTEALQLQRELGGVRAAQADVTNMVAAAALQAAQKQEPTPATTPDPKTASQERQRTPPPITRSSSSDEKTPLLASAQRSTDVAYMTASGEHRARQRRCRRLLIGGLITVGVVALVTTVTLLSLHFTHNL